MHQTRFIGHCSSKIELKTTHFGSFSRTEKHMNRAASYFDNNITRQNAIHQIKENTCNK